MVLYYVFKPTQNLWCFVYNTFECLAYVAAVAKYLTVRAKVVGKRCVIYSGVELK